jgi:large exoprotein involved in heme utilization and adhesion
MRRGSSISATAGLAGLDGNGGNITINAPKGFLVTAPNENNDITANAFNGSGGRVTINAYGVYWFTPRSRADLERLLKTTDPAKLDPQLLPTNDITAVSQGSPNLNGTVTITTPDVDPNRGLAPLPVSLVDTSNQIAQRCPQRGNPKASSSFYITGNGGVPTRPGDVPLSYYPTGTVQTVSGQPTSNAYPVNPTKAVAATANELIVEAQNWVIDANGDVILLAETPAMSGWVPGSAAVNCPP